MEILNLPMNENDANATTIKQYLQVLLLTLWLEREGFSGKRPFGNSGWHYELYLPLIKYGLVQGELDEEGFLVDIDREQANILIEKAIREL